MKKLTLGILITLSILNASEVTPTKVLELLGFNALYRHLCGPNSADVKVMKPMAEKISAYIIKNGIPKSLKDIPDLPYGLVGCKKVQENFEKCTFYQHKQFEIEMYILGDIDIEAYSKTTETGLRYELYKKDNDTQWVLSRKDIAFSSKIDGICNPMRQ